MKSFSIRRNRIINILDETEKVGTVRVYDLQDGIEYDAIGYGIAKEDWENGKITLVNWNDFKC